MGDLQARFRRFKRKPGSDLMLYRALFGKGFVGLLDEYPGAAAAYSLQRLAASTTNVVRVRRSSDDSEQDFTAAQVSDGTLTTFCGAGDGFVTTWYDQSGNVRNATQATAASQPQIVSAGALVTDPDTNNPSLLFDSSLAKWLKSIALASATSNHESIFAVARWTIGGTNPTLLGSNDNAYRLFGSIDSEIVFVAGGFAGADAIDYGDNLSTLKLITAQRNNPDGFIRGWIDGVLKDEETTYATDSTEVISVVGARGDGNQPWGGYGSTFISYHSDQSANRAAIEAKLADIYGITLA